MHSPQTSQTLLLRLQSREDESAWGAFVDLYTPLLYRHARSRGLQPADASDVVQETMRRLFLALPRFDYRPDRARFRTWLFRVAENQVRQFYRSRSRRPAGDGRTTVMAAAEAAHTADAGHALEHRWEIDYRRRLFHWAAGRVRPEFSPRIWTAFWRTAVRDEQPESIGRELGMTRAAVYMARSRCLRRIRQHIENAGGREFDPADCPDLPAIFHE